ncbi:MAG: TrkA family potassium uptake protein [Clostridia bacterium]|nr:TrkA family potassium uptake protein [Clostridia bacterium]
MRSFLVIGLGRFGFHLAKELSSLGAEVFAVDTDEEIVQEISEFVSSAQIADCTDEDVVDSIGVSNFDECFVCMGSDFADSIEITLLLRERGAKRIICKTDSERHAKLLMRCGADEIIYPERDEAHRAARRHVTKHAFDYYPLSDDFAVFEISPIDAWVGKTVSELSLRNRHNINVIGVMRSSALIPVISPDFTFRSGENIVIAGAMKDITRMLGKL